MRKSFLEFYGLAICFGAIIYFIICAGIAGYSLIQIAKPDFTMSIYSFYDFQSNDAFWKHCSGRCGPGPNDKNKPRPSEADLTKERMAAYDVALAEERHAGMRTLVRELIKMFVNLLAFFSHWVIAKRARLLAAA